MNTGKKLLNPDYRDMVECLLNEGVDIGKIAGEEEWIEQL